MKGKRKMTKICLKCMGSPCQCVDEKEWFKLYIYKTGVVDTGKALKVILARQVLDNGFEIKSGIPVWIPGMTVNHITNGGRMAEIPGWKVNEIIRTRNIDIIKKRI